MKSLVVYYSRTGTTKKVAVAISKPLESEIEEIIDTKKRSGLWGFLVSAWDAKRQKLTEIKNIKMDPSQFDITIIGTPVWANTIPPPIRTYISQKRKQIAKVAFFCTYSGRGYESTFAELEKVTGKKPVALVNLRAKEVKKGDYIRKIKNYVNALSK